MHLEDVPTLTKQGVKVRYVLFPRQGPGSETYNRAVSVWCATDRVKAVGDAKAGKPVPAKTCDNPVNENLALAERLGVNGTPAIFLDDGRRLPGYVPADKMLVMLGMKGDAPPRAAKQ
jgi:thiol:disulfide interchange protein DsbC